MIPRQRVAVAYLPLHASEVDPIPAGEDSRLQDLVEDGFMQDLPLSRGE
jgi:hypothetical protein